MNLFGSALLGLTSSVMLNALSVSPRAVSPVEQAQRLYDPIPALHGKMVAVSVANG
jgi:hypothetical protein